MKQSLCTVRLDHRLPRSVEFILRIQKWRAKFPWLDMYFRVWTFTGESDFYFILLPLMVRVQCLRAQGPLEAHGGCLSSINI